MTDSIQFETTSLENFGAEAKKAKRLNAIFESSATLISLELESEDDVKNTIYAIINTQDRTLIIRQDDEVKNLEVYTQAHGKMIISLDEKKLFDYFLNLDGEQMPLTCYMASYTMAFSTRLSAAKQALISRSIAKLDAIISVFIPSFFNRKKFRQLTETYNAYKKTVLADKADETLYVLLSQLALKIMPQALDTLSALHMQLI